VLLLLLLLLLLQARAMWLVGACGTELESEQWINACDLSVQHTTEYAAAAAAASDSRP
jgi:hypothetical protein